MMIRLSKRGAVLAGLLCLGLILTPYAMAQAPAAPSSEKAPPASGAAQAPPASQTTGQTPAETPEQATETTAGTQAPSEVQVPATTLETKGWIGFIQAQSSGTALGTVVTLDLDLGYAFNDHLSVDAGLPFILTRTPFPPVATKDFVWEGLWGSPYVDVKYSSLYHGARYTSILTGTIPVNGEDQVYGTGRFGVDWFNHIEGDLAGTTPFLNLGASNGAVDRFIMPRPYSEARPYQTLGFLADFEGGLEYKVRKGFARGLGIGGSYYALVPGGPQKVFSRFVVPYSSLGGDGQHYRYWDATFLTTNPINLPGAQALTGQQGRYNSCSVVNNVVSCAGGLAAIARDNGWSAWLDVTRSHPVDIKFGYTRSVHYRLDIYSIMVNFDGRSLLRNLLP